MCSINKTHGKPFCAGGCPMPEGNTNCGETRTLDIINEFKRLYEQRMEEIDRTNCGDSLQEKIKLQQDWIGQLTEQNESLARVVEELEVESIERVRMLEEKLQKSAACICEERNKLKDQESNLHALERRVTQTECLSKELQCKREECESLQKLNRLMENESKLLQTKNHELEDTLKCCNCEKANLLENVNEAKSTIQALEIQFNDFLQERDQLKSKYNLAVKQCSQLTEECNKIKAQNCCLKSELDELRRQFECCCEDKMMVEKKVNELKMGFNNLKGNKISAEEIHKMNKTVDALQTTLEKSRIIHEEEERAKETEIKTLKHTVKELEDCIRCCKQNLMEKETEINKLIHTVKDSEDRICGCKQNIKNKNSEIKMQNQNVQELEGCICNLQKQLKAKNNDISALNARVKELERYIRDLEEKENPLILNNVDILKNKIKELQTSISQLQSKAKLCKMCRQTIKVTFTGCNEVQTDAQEPTDEQLELLLNRDDLIKYQSCTLEKMQQELQNVCAREKQLLEEKQTYFNEKTLLEDKMLILERKLNRVQNTQEELSNKEEIIRKQKEALTLLQIEADNLRKREAEMRSENEECCICMQQLKIKINELEMAVDNAEKRGNNLQSAVDLYNNSINVLEASEEKYKLEIDHQRTTIVNLQDALMTTKHELDEYRQKYDESVSPSWTSWFGLSEPKPTPTNNNKKAHKSVHDI